MLEEVKILFFPLYVFFSCKHIHESEYKVGGYRMSGQLHGHAYLL